MSSATIYTIGYTGLNPNDLATVAKRLGLVVIDTRFSPRSRNPAWNGGALAKLLQTRYVHISALGNKNYKNGGPIEIANLNSGLQIASMPLLRGISIVLLCACEHVETCHRRIVADALGKVTGLPVVHWTPADVKRLAAGEGQML